MAQNEVIVKFRITEDGNLESIAQKADKASKSTDNLNKSRNRYSKTEKGVGQLTNNSTKAFAKQASAIGGGLVPAYATLAANVFAVTAAFGILQRAASVKQLEEGLIFTGRAAGQNLPMIVDGLREITGLAVSTADAMKTVAVGISAGFSQTQIEGLATVARGASLALGRDMTDAMDRLTRGAAKLEPEILDELGIMVRLDDATNDFAATMGKSASELTQFERRMAFTNAIIEQGEQKFAALSAVVDPNPYDKLAASFDDLAKTLLNGLNTFFKPFVNFLAENLTALVGLFGAFSVGVVKQAIPALTAGGEAAAEFSAELADGAKASIANAKSFKGAPKVFDKLADSITDGTASAEDMEAAQRSLTKSIDLHEKQMPGFIKAHGEGSAAVLEKQQKLDGARGALNAITTAQTLETQATIQATKADALNAMGAGNLRQALSLAKTAIMQEWAATMLSAKGKGVLSGALTILTGAFRIATFSVRLFGIALLNALPIIGQVIFVGSLLYSMFKDFFSKPPTALDEALEKNKERFEEFPEVINQMNIAIAASTTAAEEFLNALKPSTGIMNQLADAAASLLMVQKNENLEKQVQARLALVKARQAEVKAQERAARVEQNIQSVSTASAGNLDPLIDAETRRQLENARGVAQANVERDLAAALQEVVDAQEQVNVAAAALNEIDTEATIEGLITTLSTGIATFDTMAMSVTTNAEATEMFTRKSAALQKILDDLMSGAIGPEAAAEALKKAAAEANSLQNSADAAADSVKKITDIMAKRTQVTGLFADDIKALTEALDNLASGKDYTAILKKYGDIFKAYGIDPKDVEGLNQFLKQLKAINREEKQRALNAEFLKRSLVMLNATGNAQAAIQREINFESDRRVKLQAQMEKELKSKKFEDARATLLEIEKSITKELQKQLELISQKAEDQGRLGGSIMGAGATFAGTVQSSIEAGTVPQSGDYAEGFRQLNTASQATIANMKKMGPEGEAYAAMLGGAMNIAESWSSSLDVISASMETLDDANATSAEKFEAKTNMMIAGMQAVGATINAIGQMQQAQAKQAVAGIDRQISAEKKRDGKSKESLAKIAALEKRKEKIKRKAFEQDKKMKSAEVVMATGVAIMNSVKMGLPWGAVFGAMAAAMGAAQLAAIQSMTYDGGANSGPPTVSKVAVGNRQNVVDLARAKSPSGELAYARGSSGTGSGMTNYRPTPSFTGTKYRATGGNTAFMVGEQGPEMFVPDRAGTIVPADETDTEASTPLNVSFTVNAMDTVSMEEMLLNQRGNIIGMIREAANASGETFIESVNVISDQYGG